MKHIFEPVAMEIVAFAADDVIATSKEVGLPMDPFMD